MKMKRTITIIPSTCDSLHTMLQDGNIAQLLQNLQEERVQQRRGFREEPKVSDTKGSQADTEEDGDLFELALLQRCIKWNR